MAGSPERRIKTFFFPVIGISIIVAVLSSCTPKEVLVVNDPYLPMIQGQSQAPDGTLFALRARFSRLRITTVNLDENEDLPGLLARLEKVPSTVVLTPPNTASLKNLVVENTRFVILGGYPQFPSSQAVISVVPDRRKAIEELGRITADFVETAGKPALAIFQAATEDKLGEIGAFRAGLGSSGEIRILNLADMPGRELPKELTETINNQGLLVLLAGPGNIALFLASDDSAVPVITEEVHGIDAWNERIVASVENDNSEMLKALIRILRSERPESVNYYPSRIEKGILFKKRGR